MNPLFLMPVILSLLGAPLSAGAMPNKNEQVVGSASRLSDKHFDERSFQQKVDTYVRRVHTEFDQWKPGEDQKEVKHVGTWVLNRVERITPQMPLDALARSISELSQVLDRLELNSDKAVVSSRLQPIRSVLAVKISAGLCHHARKKLLNVLDSLQEHIAYWRYQEGHQLYYFLHKSPIKWFSRNTQRQEINQHIRLLEGARREHFRVLGQLISACRGFNDEDLDGGPSGAPYVWAVRVVRTVQSMCGRPSLLQADTGAYGSLINAARDVAPALIAHKDTIDGVIDRAKKPNHLVRHWMSYTAAATAIGATVWYLHKNPGKINELTERAKLAATDSYNNYLKGPFEKIGDALGFWDKGGDIKADFVEEQARHLRAGIERVKANIPDGQKVVSEELQQKFANTLMALKTYNDAPKAGKFTFAVDFPPFPLSDNDIVEASRTLSGDTLNKALDHLLDNFPKASATQLPELVGQLAPIVRLIKDVTAFRGGNVIDGLAESIGAIEEVIVVFMKQSEVMMTQNKLTIASIALVPAGFLVWGGYEAIKKGGNLLLPRPYDDTPIKDAILGARDLMDDCKFLDGTEDMADVQVGKLFYYLTRIGKEAKNVSPEHRKALLKYLRRAEIADSIDGKRVFLKKMYREYKEWHKTADPA
jgi:hypothetical protein